jgi:transcriptional regulator with XRE-family HTH domain
MSERSARTGATTYAADVGARLRAVRGDRSLSLGALARLAGVGKGSLSEIEHGLRNPTLATLYALANALDVPLAALLPEPPGRPDTAIASPGITARLLDTDHQPDGTTVETYVLDLEPGEEHRSDPHGAGVVEHLHLTLGRARVGTSAEPVEIGTGESVTWPADTPHGYRALDGRPARGVLVIRTPPRG